MKTFNKSHNISIERMEEIFIEIFEMKEPGFLSIGETFNYYSHLLRTKEERMMFYDYLLNASNLSEELIEKNKMN